MGIKSTSYIGRERALKKAAEHLMETGSDLTFNELKAMDNGALGDLLDPFYTFDNWIVLDTEEEAEQNMKAIYG